MKLIATSASDKALYAALGLPESATSEEIHAAFLRIALQHHPDRGELADSELFSRAKSAHDVLIDKEKRAIYDMTGIDPDDKANSQMLAAIQVIMQTAFRIIDDGGIEMNILESVRRSLYGDIQSAKTQLSQIDRMIGKMEQAANNIEERWSGAESVKRAVIAMILGHVEQNRLARVPMERQCELATFALSLLSSATYQMQPAEMIYGMSPFINLDIRRKL